MTSIICILLLFSFTSCGSNKGEKDVGLPASYDILKRQYDKKLLEVKEKSDVKTGWRDVTSCDAMLWAGKYACGGRDVNLAASEYPDAGRFGRRPLPDCWTQELGDVAQRLLGAVTWAWA